MARDRRALDPPEEAPALSRTPRDAVHGASRARSPERLLTDLNEAQREAVRVTSGALVILAGAGSGKTRVVSRRAAYAIETGVVEPDQVLLVTFTDRAAGEMVERMAALGHPRVMARTFHAAALAQLRFFWPTRHAGEELPRILSSKLELLVPLARRLPGGYRFTPAKDLADGIEWAKLRRIPPERWVAQGQGRAPIPPELFATLYRDYERAKAGAGRLDFEDLLVQTVELLETDAAAAATVRARKRWFSVDEYQDTNPLAERLRWPVGGVSGSGWPVAQYRTDERKPHASAPRPGGGPVRRDGEAPLPRRGPLPRPPASFGTQETPEQAGAGWYGSGRTDTSLARRTR